MAVLRIYTELGEEVFELGDSTTVGRDESSHVQILDPLVSRSHARIRRMSDGRYLLEDAGSRHGTYKNGERAHKVHLKHGDEVTVGSTKIVFEDEKQARIAGFDEPSEELDVLVMRRQTIEFAPAFLPGQAYKDPEALRHDFERLRVAYEVSRAIGTLTDLDSVMDAVLDAAFQLLAADRGAVLLRDESGDMVLRASRRSDGSREHVVVSTSILREVVDTKTGVVCADAGRDVRFGKAESVQAQALRSTMSVPLLFKDEVLGVLHLDSQTATGVFGEKDLQLFASIANQAAIAIKSAYLSKKSQEEARQREELQRFLPPSLVEQLMRGELKLGKRGTLHEVTVLFLDIRGFTRLSENTPPEGIVQLLNEFFEVMLEVLFRHRGTFDKYIGDEIMALFGVPLAMDDAADHAVACALDMQRSLVHLNRRRALEEHQPIEMGIGIHSGPAVCGAIGAARTMQYTAIGDTVNTAARICSAARSGQLLISSETASRLTHDFGVERLGALRLKGKQRPVEVAQVVGHSDEPGEVTMS